MRYERNEIEVKNVRFCLFLQGSRAEPLPLYFIEAIPFGLIGLGLAVLDFTGASRKLEEALRRYIEVEKSDAADARKNLFTTDLAYHREAFQKFLIPAAVLAIGLIIIWISGDDADRPAWLLALLPNWPWWSAFLWGPIVLLIWYVFDHLTGEGFRYLISVVIWRLFWLLSLPKSGIIGSIGLLVALADNLIG